MSNSNEVLIKYVEDNDQGFDLRLLGESFTGLDTLFKELCDLTGIKGEIQVKTKSITHGSVDVHNVIYITLTSLPFNNPSDLYEFLRLANPEMLKQAQSFFSGTLGVNETLNSYFARYPLDATVLTYLTGKFFVRAIKWTKKQKKQLTTRDNELGEISPRQAKQLRSMVVSGKYKRALKPLTDGNIRTLKIATDKGQFTASINEVDLDSYLPDEDTILPEFENGKQYKLTGQLVSLQSARGEILQIKLDGVNPSHSLVTSHPHDGETTEDYKDLYKQKVSFTAEAVRISMYKRPQFVIHEMQLLQQEIFDQEIS